MQQAFRFPRRRGLWLARGILAGMAWLPLAALAALPAAPYQQDVVLVAFKDQATRTTRLQTLHRRGLSLDARNSSPYFSVVRIGAAARAAGTSSVASALDALRRDPTVRLAEPDYLVHAMMVPDDPLFSTLWGLRNTGQSIRGVPGMPGADIDATDAWDLTTGSPAVIVAVIDSGVDYNHPDLSDNILRDADGNVVGYNFVNNTNNPLDDYGHGTHVSGTIGAAGNNGLGVAGVCWSVKIMPVKFLNAGGTGTTDAAIRSTDFATDHGAQIMSNSWGGGGFSQLLLEAIQRARDAGILYVAAAGNNGQNNDIFPHYPANYNGFSDNILSVAATDNRDRLASFSDYGVNTVDIAAPGVDTYSTLRGGGYGFMSGTSMATPHVSGAAALILSLYPDSTVAQLKTRLLEGSVGIPSLAGRIANGRLNAYNALTYGPGAISDLTATASASRSLTLSWTATGENGSAGMASRYELRYSKDPITPDNFGDVTLASDLPDPSPAGTPESYVLSGLDADTDYFVALRAFGRADIASGLAIAGPFHTQPAE